MFRPGEFVGLRPGWGGCEVLAGREVRVGEGGSRFPMSKVTWSDRGFEEAITREAVMCRNGQGFK